MKAQNPTILIAEDDPNDQMFIERAFRQAGVQAPLHIVDGGFEAIAYMEGRGEYADRNKFPYPTFVMTDLKMPHGDGFTVLENLKNRPEWAIIPVIVFSVSADLDDIKKAYWLGASAFHTKPQEMGAMRTQVKLLYEYWSTAEVPQVDSTGKQLPTDSAGKLGERFDYLHEERKQPQY